MKIQVAHVHAYVKLMLTYDALGIGKLCVYEVEVLVEENRNLLFHSVYRYLNSLAEFTYDIIDNYYYEQ